jgi:hypothetical protein
MTRLDQNGLSLEEKKLIDVKGFVLTTKKRKHRRTLVQSKQSEKSCQAKVQRRTNNPQALANAIIIMCAGSE